MDINRRASPSRPQSAPSGLLGPVCQPEVIKLP
jgi:hypothetical protein